MFLKLICSIFSVPDSVLGAMSKMNKNLIPREQMIGGGGFLGGAGGGWGRGQKKDRDTMDIFL